MPRLVYGTMRLCEHEGGPDDWARFFARLYENGITWLHSSAEYESFDLLCETLSVLRSNYPRCEFHHVVKLAEPSFGEENFVSERLNERLEHYRRRLGVKAIDEVQWMWRGQLDDDPGRVETFRRQGEEISRTFEGVKCNGGVDRFLCFPYSVPFAEAALQLGGLDGLAVYRNLREKDYDEVVARCRPPQRVLAIRPFGAGECFDGNSSTREMLDYVFKMPAVDGAVFTATMEKHIKEVLDYLC